MSDPVVLQQAIFPYMSNHAAVKSEVDTRIFPHQRPQGSALPALTYFEVTGEQVESHQGGSGLAGAVLQFSAWANTYLAAAKARDAARKALQGLKDTIGLGAGIQVQGTAWVGQGEDYEDDTGIYHAWLRVRVWHRVEVS